MNYMLLPSVVPLMAAEAAREASQREGLQWSVLLEDQGLPLALLGMAAVFLALGLLIVFITMLPHLVEGVAKLTRVTPPSRPAAPIGPSGSNRIPDHTLVVIAAAVAEVVSQPHRILQTQLITSDDMAWSNEGRRQHHISHRTRGRW